MSLFLHEDVKALLYNKFIVVIGDSIQRGIYKDLVALLQGNHFLSRNDLKMKGEESFMGDKLLEGGCKGTMNNGVNYREVRQYKTESHLVRFYFVTRIHNSYWREVIFHDLSCDPHPDVIVMNSCLWDISRYGPFGMQLYKENLEKTFQTLTKLLPECTCLWNTALPVANRIKGGFLLPELSSLCDTLRLDVLEGNYYARQLAVVFDINVLDLNYFFRSFMALQVTDGVHWNFKAHRRFTNLLLAHLAKIWNIKLPYRQEISELNTQKPATKMKTQKPTRTPATQSKRDPKHSLGRWDIPPCVPKPQSTAYTSFSSDYAPSSIMQSVQNDWYSSEPQHTYQAPQRPTPGNQYQAPQYQHVPQGTPYMYYSSREYSQQFYHQSYQQNNQYNANQWYPDGNFRRQQRILSQRQQEVAGATMNLINNQFRVN